MRPAQALGTAPSDRGIGPGQLGCHLGDRQRLLDPLEEAMFTLQLESEEQEG